MTHWLIEAVVKARYSEINTPCMPAPSKYISITRRPIGKLLHISVLIDCRTPPVSGPDAFVSVLTRSVM